MKTRAARRHLCVGRSSGAYTVRLSASFHDARRDGMVVLTVHKGGKAWTPFVWVGRNGPDAAMAIADAMRMSDSVMHSIDAGLMDSCWAGVSRRLS